MKKYEENIEENISHDDNVFERIHFENLSSKLNSSSYQLTTNNQREIIPYVKISEKCGVKFSFKLFSLKSCI